MAKQITYGSVCSGIEAASLAFEPLGWQPSWFAEIDQFPAAVLSHHWPHVPNHGDMTSLPEKILSGGLVAPDVLVGGTPCQAFSVAGVRGSLDDDRGNLTLVLVRILDAIDTVRRQRGQPPALLVWENVPGVLSTKDNAFGCFLGALAGENLPLKPAGGRWTNAGCVLGAQRKIAWRALDAQFFGVAQRRKRVFVVASAGDVDPAKILFERQSQGRDFEESRGKEAKVTSYAQSSFGNYKPSSIGATLTANGGMGYGGAETLVLHDNIINRTERRGGNGLSVISDVAYTLTTTDRHAVQQGPQIRRLTPIECERLQGIPDNHTRIPWRGKLAEACPDGPRYKAIGNSMAVPVMRWIGDRIDSIIFKD